MSASYHRTEDAALEPLTLDEAKDWLRVTDTTEDVLITSMVKAARQAIERRTKRAMLEQTWALLRDAFPAGSVIYLPIAKVLSVESIGYVDTAGASQTFSSDNYETDFVREPGRIVLKPSASWPSIEEGINKVTVEFTAGYGDERGDVPEDLKTAVRYILADWFSSRREYAQGTTVTKIPMRAEMIIWSYRVFS